MTEGDSSRKVLTLACQHLISNDITDVTYDGIICGTGYDRKSWLRLLRASNLAEDYIGHEQDSGRSTVVKLAPEHHHGDNALNLEHIVDQGVKYELVDFVDHDVEPSNPPSLPDSTPHSSSGSSTNSPPSSPGLSLSETPATVALRISRNYRLISRVPRTSSDIYLQGCAEATHGLSDTLLSVLGVRAGEVLDDICRNENEGRRESIKLGKAQFADK